LDYGEEDLDWRIESIPGKGLGVVALRDFPALSRIMVDRGYTRFKIIVAETALNHIDPSRVNFTAFYELIFPQYINRAVYIIQC